MAFFDIFKKKQDTPPTGEQAQKQQEELSAGLEKTKTGLFSKLARAVAGRSTIDAGVLDDLEEVLISSDVGVETTVKIIRRIEERVARDKYMNASELQSILRAESSVKMRVNRSGAWLGTLMLKSSPTPARSAASEIASERPPQASISPLSSALTPDHTRPPPILSTCASVRLRPSATCLTNPA